jgi:hypothetical protein
MNVARHCADTHWRKLNWWLVSVLWRFLHHPQRGDPEDFFGQSYNLPKITLKTAPQRPPSPD